MYAVGDSPAMSKDANIFFSPAFSKHSDGEFVNCREHMDPDLNRAQQDHQLMSSGLAQYCSAPSSFFAGLMDGGRFEELLNGSVDAEAYDLQFPATAVKQEIVQEEQNQYSASAVATHVGCQGSSVDHHRQDWMDGKDLLGGSANLSGGSSSNLARQNSSPPEFFSNLTVENGLAVMGDMGNFNFGNGIGGKSSPTTRLNDHLNFSSGESSSPRYMPLITKNGNESDDPWNKHLRNGNSSDGFYAPSSQNDSASLSSLKRGREGEVKFLGLSSIDGQDRECQNFPGRLVHHLSMPKTSSEMAAIEKYLQFQQDAVQCKIRAKRGCATHPRSIAERMRRTRISDRMKKLQDLFPNIDKQTNTADMLDLAVEYIKDLQNQVQALGERRAKCTCSK